MLVKTEAILIHYIRYSDNSLVARFYTREYGRVAVMIKGLSSRKGGVKISYFQPLNIFDLELYHSESREIHNLREMSLRYVPLRIPGDLKRSSVALFMSEILHNIIREEDRNELLYDFIESSVLALDGITEGISNFHIWFLVSLTAYTGIGPSPTSLDRYFFDMIAGHFTEAVPVHTDYLDLRQARILNSFLDSDINDIGKILLTGEERSELLDRLVRYYQLHLPGIKQIRSLQVLKDIYH